MTDPEKILTRAEVEAYKNRHASHTHVGDLKWADRALATLDRAMEIVEELATSGVEIEDARMSYAVVQVSREILKDARELHAAYYAKPESSDE